MSSQSPPIPPSSTATSRQASEERWRELMRSAQNGDARAYSLLLAELLPMLRRIVGHKWRNANNIEDIVQEILLSVHAVRHTYDSNRPFMPWLMTIANRRIADAARYNAGRAAHETTVDIMPETFSGDQPKSTQDLNENHDLLREAMSVLPESQREAIELMKLKELTLAETAKVTGKSIASLKVSVHRAIKAMRAHLEGKQ